MTSSDRVVTGADLVRRYVREQTDALLRQDERVRRDAPGAVHDARVATRRLRSALRTFRPLLDAEVTESVRDELRWWGGVLGAARDREVQRDRVRHAVDGLDPAAVPEAARARLAAELGTGYGLAHAAAVQLMDHDRYGELVAALRRLAAAPPFVPRAARPAPKVARGALRRTWRRLKRRHRVVQEHVARVEEPWREDDEPGWPAASDAPRDTGPDPVDPALAQAIHELRKAAKAARYAGEACVPALGAAARRYASACEDLQDLLGEHHDAVVLHDALADMGARARLAGEDDGLYDVLARGELARARSALHDLPRAWRDVRRRRPRRR